MGNIIPLRDAVRKHGADPIRLTILISAELLQDADFNVEAINGIKNKLEVMYKDSTKIIIYGFQGFYDFDNHRMAPQNGDYDIKFY